MNRLEGRDEPVPPAARREPGRLVPVGRRGLRARARGGQADLPLDRLLRLPLVPRDGARVVLGAGDRRADERELRLHQGRPRGAAGRRLALHGRRRRDQRQRRLAAQRVPPRRRQAVLGRDVPAARAAAQPPELPRRPRRRPPTPGATSARSSRRRRSRSPSTSASSPRCKPVDAPVDEELDRAGDREHHLLVRLGVGRLGARAEVPGGERARVPASAGRCRG